MNKEARFNKRLQMIEPFTDVDLCACGIQLVCEGKCRDAHTSNGKVQCGELYQITIKVSRKGERSVIET